MLAEPASRVASRRLLIFGPDPEWREAIASVAAWPFPEVVSAGTFATAQQPLSQNSFTASIAEYHFTRGAGLALYEQVRLDNPKLHFILTCFDLRVAPSHPSFRSLRTPFDWHELLDLLRSMSSGR